MKNKLLTIAITLTLSANPLLGKWKLEWKVEIGKMNWAFSPIPVSDKYIIGTSDGADKGYLIDTRSKSVIKWFPAGSDAEGVALADVDNDNQPEIIFGSEDLYLYVYELSGSLKWKYKTQGEVISSPAIGDVDGDGELEVVFGSLDRNLYVLRGRDGKLEWKFETGGDVRSSPAIGDVDGDGELEVVFGSLDRNLYVLRGRDGKLEWKFETGNDVYSSPAIGDVDGDGELEVVFGSDDNNLYVLRGRDGKLEWKYQTGNDVDASPAIGDVDGDGELEVVFGSVDNNLYVLRGRDGKLEWKYQTGDDVDASPAIGDVDGDGELEVVFGSWDNNLYVLRGRDGKLEWKFETGNWVSSSPAIGDVDGDGELEVVFGSYDGYLYCASAGGMGTVVWAKFRGDAYNTGYYLNALSYGDWVKNPQGFWYPGWSYTPIVYHPQPQPQVTDNTPPEIVILTPEQGRSIAVVGTGAEVDVSGIAKDPSGIATVTVGDKVAALMPIANGASFTAKLNLPPGTHEIKVKAVDRAGNIASKVIEVHVTGHAATSYASASLPTIWALIVGVSRYEHKSLNLKYTDDDARLFKWFLEGPHVGVPSDHIVMLIDEQATRARILAELEKIMRRAGPKDLIIVYMSMHGMPYGRSLYLIPHDGDPQNITGTGVSEFDLYNSMSFTQCKRILFIFDACHSGDFGDLYAMFSPGGPTRAAKADYASKLNELMFKMAYTREGVGLLASTSGVDLSVEGSKWGGGHGVFTWYLVKGLKGAADMNGDGVVTLGEAFNYTRNKVLEDTHYQQTPRLVGGDDNWPLSMVR